MYCIVYELKLVICDKNFMVRGNKLRKYFNIFFVFGVLMASVLLVHEIKAAEFTCMESISAKDIDDIVSEYPGYQRVAPGSCAYLLIKGRINRGDAKIFSELISQSSPALAVISIVSEGGNLADAMEIGRAIRKNMIETHAPYRLGSTADGIMMKTVGESGDIICRGSECSCASSCFLIWLAGISRFGDNLLIHRPYIEPIVNKTLTYQASKDTIDRQLASLRSYLREMEIPDNYFDTMMSIPSHEGKYLTSFQLERIGDHPPSVSEWLAAACGIVPNYSSEELAELIGKTNRTSYENIAVEKWYNIRSCESDRIINERLKR